jgi:hypothetical protein
MTCNQCLDACWDTHSSWPDGAVCEQVSPDMEQCTQGCAEVCDAEEADG